ncbi:MAG: SMP-30/gluconolactonase/LRE family protein [Dehalococcoidia bacterium]
MAEWNWELVAKQGNLTEGPAWDGEALLYSECAASLTWRYDPGSKENTVWREDTNGANGMVFDRHGRLFACEGAGRRIVRYEKDAPAEVVVDNFEGKAFNEPNDLAIDSQGRIFFSDPNYGGRPMELDHESVYRADPVYGGSWSVHRVTFDTERPNGVLFSADQETLYVAESPREMDQRRQLRAYPVNSDGSLGDHSVLHDFGPGRGIDGMCLTTDGNIVATAGHHDRGPGPMVYVFAPNGRVISTHPAPADRPTNCTYAEAGLDVLYVTFGGGEVYRAPNTGHRGHLAYPSRNS